MKAISKAFFVLNIVFVLFSAKSYGWNNPTLLTPANGSNVFTGVTLDWSSVAGSQFYQVQADTVNTFNSPVLVSALKTYINSSGSNTDTEHTLVNLFFGKTYFWRVRAYISGDTSVWSAGTFKTIDYVSLSSPLSGSNTFTGVTLDWQAHAGVKFYDVQADTTSTFNSPALVSASTTYINSNSSNTDTDHTFGDLFFGKAYFWRVRARNAVDTSAWKTDTFKTVDYVSLSSPLTGSNNWTGVTLDWQAHAGVKFYDVQADTTSTFNSPALVSASKTYINSNSSNTDTDHSFGDLYFGKTYYWRVRARNAVDTSAWKADTFKTVDYVSLSSPLTGSNNWTGVTLDWQAHPGVKFYDVQADTTNTFNSPALVSASKTYINSNSSNTDTDHSFGDLYFGKTYYWRVRARNAVDTSAWKADTFKTVDYVSLSSPLTGSNNWTGVTLDWQAHPGVKFYDVQADTTNTFNSPALASASKTYINSNSSNTDTDHTFGNLYFGKTYYWRVRARNSVDTTAWSTDNFKTVDYVSLSSPLTGSNNWTGVTLDWQAHPGVKFYDVQSDTTITFNSLALVSASTTYVNSNSSNTDTDHTFGNLYFGKTYYWRVRARNTVDTTAWSTNTFKTVDYVSLVSPNNGQINVSATGITLDWTSHPGIGIYQLEMDTVNLFNSPLLIKVDKNYINSNSSNTDTQNATGALMLNQVYFWRVRAINSLDTSAWTTRVFSTGSCVPPGQPIAILGNTAVCHESSNTYSITAVSGAVSYTWTLPGDWKGSSANTSINVTAGSVSGNIRVIATNTCGSSAAQTINVTVNTVNTSVTQSGAVLTANAAGAAYLWINCTGKTLISGESNQSYTASANGNYAVIVKQAGCSDTSTCMNITFVGVVESTDASALNVYPNPSKGKFTIEAANTLSPEARIEIYNAIGEKVYTGASFKQQTSKEIDLSKELKGIYFVKLYDKEKVFIKKIVVQ